MLNDCLLDEAWSSLNKAKTSGWNMAGHLYKKAAAFSLLAIANTLSRLEQRMTDAQLRTDEREKPEYDF